MDWEVVSRRNARSVQTTVGWIFWDPGAVERYAAAGLPAALAGPLGYIAARGAPLAAAGPAAVVAAFGSISPPGIAAVFDLLAEPRSFDAYWSARDAAILEGLAHHAPDILGPLADFGPLLWDVVDRLPLLGRVFFGAHLAVVRPEDPVLSGWHAVNCLREWRGDTHWALVVAAGLTHAEASILHNAWLGYEGDWLAQSRGTSPPDIEAGWAALAAKGLAADRTVTAEGIGLRQRLEDDTDRLTTAPWTLLGQRRAVEFAQRFEPPCVQLLARVDATAGLNYQPASRIRSPGS
ncbi:MAG TPA: hypothetical protein VID75_05835 [Acidimicrobiales bacterium]